MDQVFILTDNENKIYRCKYCEEKYDDKNYYEQWLNENALKYEYELHDQKEKCKYINCYEFHIRWKYK